MAPLFVVVVNGLRHDAQRNGAPREQPQPDAVLRREQPGLGTNRYKVPVGAAEALREPCQSTKVGGGIFDVHLPFRAARYGVGVSCVVPLAWHLAQRL